LFSYNLDRLELLDRREVRLADTELEPVRSRKLGAAAGQQFLGVVRLEPIAQKLRWNRYLYNAPIVILKLYAAKPARKYILAKLSAQTALNAAPLMFNRGI
jgi:hypothetical protein